MLESIVVPLDGSPLAEMILGQVRRLLFHKDAKVLLVRAVENPVSVEAMAELPDIIKAQAAKYLTGVAARLSSQGARVDTFVREGHAADVILDLVNEERASLIAMSTHGRGGFARWALGSVAEKILRASPVPVLAVRSFDGTGQESVPTGPEELSLRKILVPLDVADLSLEAVGSVREMAQLFGASVLLLHVCEGPACAFPVPQMTKAHEDLRRAGIPVEPLMKQGNPAAQILDTCREQGADLIAMTTHGRSGVSRWALGSVTEKVLRTSRVPLLIVRAGIVAAWNPAGGSAKERT